MDDQFEQVLLKVRPEFLPVRDRESALRVMADEVAAFMPETGSAERVFADAWERELVESTYIGMGLAIPHARVQGLQHAGLYAAFSPGGIPWPHEEARLISLLIVPWEAPELHLQLLSRLVRWRKHMTEAEACALAESPEKLEESLNGAFFDLM